MTGRRRIEDDVIIIFTDLAIGQEASKFIEGGNFDGTRAGQLLFHIAQGRFR